MGRLVIGPGAGNNARPYGFWVKTEFWHGSRAKSLRTSAVIQNLQNGESSANLRDCSKDIDDFPMTRTGSAPVRCSAGRQLA